MYIAESRSVILVLIDGVEDITMEIMTAKRMNEMHASYDRKHVLNQFLAQSSIHRFFGYNQFLVHFMRSNFKRSYFLLLEWTYPKGIYVARKIIGELAHQES